MKRSGVPALLLVLIPAPFAIAQPLDTAFTYQGELRSAGVPASGAHDMRFRLYDTLGGGAQVGSTLCSDNVPLTEGRFTVVLDFGSVFAGQQWFLEIEVRADTGLDCANPAGFVILGPRQALTASPQAIFALTAASATTAATASNALQLNGQPASFYQNASNLTSGTLPAGLLGGTYTGALSFSNAGNAFAGSFAGSGSGLTSLNASNVGMGMLADARLSSNVALLSAAQTFTAGKTFSAPPAFTAAVGAPFSVSSGVLVTNLNADRLDGLDSAAFLQSIPVPLTLSGSNASHIIKGENSANTTEAAGVLGIETAASGQTYGVFGRSDSSLGRGVYGWATLANSSGTGVYGKSEGSSGTGVYGFATNTGSSPNYGGYFRSSGTNGRAVAGYASAASGSTRAGHFTCESTSGIGVEAEVFAASGFTYGVYGRSQSTNGCGVAGAANATSGSTRGGYFYSASPDGFGLIANAGASSGPATGVRGTSASSSGTGVLGLASANTGSATGVWGQSESTDGIGVLGEAMATTGTTYGVYARSDSTSGRAVYGRALAASGDTRGVYGISDSTSGTGVTGEATAASGATFGGYFESNSTSGYGVYGRNSATTGTIYGVRGYASTAAGGYAVYAAGDMGASGVKPFRIDHPQDPENKYLLHYAAESPEVINFYSGKVTLDGGGEATVELPAYFASINKDPRYTLTAVGAPMPMLHVAAEISEDALNAGALAGPDVAPPICSFRIAGGVSGAKVSWEVKAVRNDLRMRMHGAPVEREKVALERGKYQHPEYYDRPPERGMDVRQPGNHDQQTEVER